MTRYSDSDAAQDTGVDSREVSDAWHQARNDHEGRGGGDDDLYDTSWRDSADSELQSWFGSGDLWAPYQKWLIKLALLPFNTIKYAHQPQF
ncbi:hypothetical protein KJ678_03225 [Patescibacteria group bacterium]|nr:hypothetical protein [Patescibacteria group bacterium]